MSDEEVAAILEMGRCVTCGHLRALHEIESIQEILQCMFGECRCGWGEEE